MEGKRVLYISDYFLSGHAIQKAIIAGEVNESETDFSFGSRVNYFP
jgi:hypothetical protein